MHRVEIIDTNPYNIREYGFCGYKNIKKELFLKHGFEVIDEAPPSFELLVRKFTNAPTPKFKGDWGKKLSRYSSGLTIIKSDQCPYCAKAVREIRETAQKFGLKTNIIELNNSLEAQNTPTAFGIFSIIYDGKLLADHPISNKRFINIMNRE